MDTLQVVNYKEIGEAHITQPASDSSDFDTGSESGDSGAKRNLRPSSSSRSRPRGGPRAAASASSGRGNPFGGPNLALNSSFTVAPFAACGLSQKVYLYLAYGQSIFA